MPSILVVGSVAYDSIATPAGKVEKTLGGSANYFAVAASFYAPVRIVGVVGDDYAPEDLELLTQRKVDVSGLQKISGRTFHWSGRYESDMNEAITLATHLNVFENFNPVLPESYRNSEYVFLANIDPVLQLRVLEQTKGPRLVGADTMNYWIDTKLSDLRQVLKRVDVLLINEGEVRKLTGEWNTVAAARIISEMGPKAVIIKRGEYGFMLFHSGQFFILPAFPVKRVVDPTGAGDTFAAGFFGALARDGKDLSLEALKRACIHGCLLASFTVEDFGLGALRLLTWKMVEERHQQYSKVIACPV